MEILFAYVTAGSRDEAERIGRALVEERLAACVNILPGMTSIYRWHGAVERAEEVVLVAKTNRGRLEELTQRVCALHSYELPCVVALPVAGGHPPYLAWIATESGHGDASA
jgi:periplasmic divalent cation tolerance protein